MVFDQINAIELMSGGKFISVFHCVDETDFPRIEPQSFGNFVHLDFTGISSGSYSETTDSTRGRRISVNHATLDLYILEGNKGRLKKSYVCLQHRNSFRYRPQHHECFQQNELRFGHPFLLHP